MLLQIFIVRMLVSFGKGCVTGGGGGDASGCRMRLPPLWTRVQPCLAWPSQPLRRLTFEDWESSHSQPFALSIIIAMHYCHFVLLLLQEKLELSSQFCHLYFSNCVLRHTAKLSELNI